MKRIASVFSWRQIDIRSAAGILMVMVFSSRLLGLIRDRLLASRFDPDMLGVYFAAFRIPNLIFELLVMGTLTSAFIPVFTKYIADDKKEESWKISASIIHLTLIVFIALSIPLFIWSNQISRFLAPGFSDTQIDMMSQFTRFMICFQVIPLLVGNFFTGVLQSYNLFFIPAAAPVIYNLGIICGIVVLTPFYGLWAPVFGVGIGAFLFVLIQVPSLLSVSYKHYALIDVYHKGVREVVKLMIPRTIGLAVSQIDTTVDLILSTLLGARMVTVFQFAQHLQQMPIGLFGVTVAQAAFPVLSQLSAKQDAGAFKKTVVSAVNQILFFILPSTVLLIVLRIPIVRLVFGASRFDWEATVLTGITVSMFSISLFAQSLSQVFTRAFYALFDSKTPVIIGVFTILLNAGMSSVFILFLHLPVWSLGLSTSISSIIHVGFLLFYLQKKVKIMSLSDFGWGPVKMLVAATIMGFTLYVPLKLLDQLVFDTTRISGLVLLTGVSFAIGMAWYLFFAWVLGIAEIQTFFSFLDKVRKPKPIILEPASEVVNNGAEQ